ncbi:MAG TPA: hypothetical protein VE995_08600 [Gaiellaceae bacterium]|nr:hypothetical protein [Gaiellaceae bacterium]
MAEPLAADEPLSPELVLVLPPELRTLALARLGPPAWPATREPAAGVRGPRAAGPEPGVPAEAGYGPIARALGTLVAARILQLAAIFAAVTAVTLVLSVVAEAVR